MPNLDDREGAVRRGVVGLAAAALLGITAVFAMDTRRPVRRPVVVGVVQMTPVDQQTLAGFKAGMAALGYREGEGVRYLHDGPAGGVERLGAILDKHLAAHVDLIFASSTPATLAAKQAGERAGIPVVFAPVNDPLGSGVVASLARPSGGVTGIRLPTGDDLRLQWLTRIAPQVREVLVPYNPLDGSAATSVAAISAVAGELGLALQLLPVTDPASLAESLRRLPGGAQAIFLPRDSMVEAAIDEIVAIATRHRIPVAAPSLQQVERGAVFAYGFRHDRLGERAARLAASVLNGVSPGDIPVESGENWLAINLAAAEAIGLHIPDDVLALADSIERN